MSDYLDPVVIQKALKKQARNSGFIQPLEGLGPRPGLSQSDSMLMPYIEEKQAEQKEEASWLTPLEFVFDILSRPQYVTANLGQDISEGKNLDKILEGAWQGLTGERKGDWTTTLFGGTDKGEKEAGAGIFPGQSWAKEKIPLLGDIPIVGSILPNTWGELIGLVANIFLDPTTYMTFGAKSGATAANKASARFAATESVKKSLFTQGSVEELKKIAGKGFEAEKFLRLGEKSMAAAEKYVNRFVTPGEMAKFNARLFKQTEKMAMGMTAEEFTKHSLSGLAEGSSEFIERASKQLAQDGTEGIRRRINYLASKNPDNEVIEFYKNYLKGTKKMKTEFSEGILEKMYKDIIESGAEVGVKGGGKIGSAIGRYTGFNDLISHYNSPEFASNIAKLGERKVADFFGKELGKGIRPMNPVARGSEYVKKLISRSPVGSFGRALANVMSGPIGFIKSALNIRNPYQDMVNQIKMENHYLTNTLIREGEDKVNRLFANIDGETLNTVRDVIDYGKSRNIADLSELVEDPGALKIMGDKDAEKIRNLILTERHLMDEVYMVEKELSDRGRLVQFTPIANYLPRHDEIPGRRLATRELGSFRPGFTKHQTLDLNTIAQQDRAVIKTFLGVDDATAQKIAEKGWSSSTLDLKEMLMYRMHAHARAVATADLVDKFMAFGVKIDQFSAAPDVIAGLKRTGYNPFANLREVHTEIPALKGMMFDQDVAKVIDRVIPVISDDKGLAGIRKAFSYLTTMFKGYATLSPGFHLRNDRSNMFTGFVNYGAGFLNPVRKLDGLVLSAYGLYGKEGVTELAKKIGLSEASINKVLNKQVAGKTYAEWADTVMTRSGIISKASMGYNLEDSISKLANQDKWYRKLNPLDKENMFFKGSREVGAVVESSSRAQGFLIDLEKMAGKNGVANEAIINEAVRNVKKYFFDYEDLSEFEKRFLKNVIPFYTWIRKNVALQVDQLVRKPGMMSVVAKGRQSIIDHDVDETELPEWARSQGAIPIDKSAEGIAKLFFPDMPYKDINQIPFMFDMEGPLPIPKVQWGDAVDNFLSMAHPVFKTATTLAGEGWDPFKRKTLESSAPAPRAFRLIQRNPQVLQFIDSAFRMVGIKDGLNIQVDSNTGKIEMDAKAAKLLEDNFLVLKTLDNMGDTITSVFPDIEKELEKVTGVKGSLDDGQRTMKALSWGLGLSQREIDLEQQKEYAFKKALREAEAEAKKNRSKNPASQRRSDMYRKAYDKRIKRLRTSVENY